MRSALAFLVLTSAAAAQTLEARYALDETTGTACVDGTGNGHDGTYQGGTLGEPGARPETGTSVRFDGVSEKVQIADGPGFTGLRKELSVACWMNPDDLSGVQRFFGNDGSWTWGLSASSIRFTTRTIKDYDHSAGLSPGTWYHVCCVFDATFAVHFYLDGALIGTIQGSQQANAPFADWHIAYKDPTYPEWFGGVLDDIQVYDGVLDSTQVQWLYDNPGKTLGGGPLGANYCGPANLNSSGGAAAVAGWGQPEVAFNELTLTATGMPAGETGYFLVAEGAGFKSLPGGSQGNLCLSGKMGRFVGQVASTGSAGEFSIDVDLSALPIWGGTAVQPGEWWYFQGWFSDGATSNFTDGLVVQFQ